MAPPGAEPRDDETRGERPHADGPPRIRAATADDAPFLAWTILAADRSHLGRGGFDLVLPGPEEERLRWFTALVRAEARSFCHWSGFLVAERQGAPAAALSGYVPRETRDADFVAACKQVCAAAGWSRGELRGLFARFAPLQTVHFERPPESWVVEWVATRPEHRGRGLAAALLDAILERGRARGCRESNVGVLIGNHPAQRAYERAGFSVCAELRHPDYEAAIGAPGARLLRRDL